MEERILYFDIVNGISGDMTIATLLDLGISKEVFLEEINKLNLGDEFNININIRQIDEIKETPDERPSNPSNRFIAFVIPTIQNTVNTFKNISFASIEVGEVSKILSITIPLATTIVAAIICPINFTIGLIPFVSSK